MSAPDPRALACPAKIPLASEGPSTQAVHDVEASGVNHNAALTACLNTGAGCRHSSVSPTTGGTNEADPFAGIVTPPSRASLRQAVRYCGATPLRRATSESRAPGANILSTIRALTWPGIFLRPVGTFSREARSSFPCRKVCKVFCKDQPHFPLTMDLSARRCNTSGHSF